MVSTLSLFILSIFALSPDFQQQQGTERTGQLCQLCKLCLVYPHHSFKTVNSDSFLMPQFFLLHPYSQDSPVIMHNLSLREIL